MRFSKLRKLMLRLILAAPLLVFPLIVAAHAELVSSSPEAGAKLSGLPAEIRLEFNEPIGDGSFATLVDEAFGRTQLASRIDPSDPTVLIAMSPAIEDGVYTLEYEAVSADNHTIRGSYQFAIDSTADSNESALPLVLGVVAGVVIGALIRRFRRTR